LALENRLIFVDQLSVKFLLWIIEILLGMMLVLVVLVTVIGAGNRIYFDFQVIILGRFIHFWMFSHWF